MPPTVQCETIEEAMDFSLRNPGRHFVMSQEILDQIEAAEAAGGFEGGMSGASGEGGFSAEGSSGENASSGDTVEGLDLDGAFIIQNVGALKEGAVDAVLGLRDLVLGIMGEAAGPVILVPKREMERFLHGGSDDEA
ncbi:MAG: hypothetical protein ABIS51_05180 [Sphingomonas sp.]